MNIKEVLADLDELFEAHRVDEVEEFLQDKLLIAKKEKDTSSMITIVNELIGFYRDMSKHEQAIAYCNQIITLMKQCGYDGSVPYATTLLNVANARRAAGLWEESEDAYQEVAKIYGQSIENNDYRYASLYNNWSLLYQEQQKFEKAKESLLKALSIISQYNNTQIEIATTHTNLATTLLRLGDIQDAMDHLIMALSIFEEDEGKDYHYSAALSAMGDAKYLQGDYQAAADYYEKAMNELELHVGRTESYERIAENLKIVQEKLVKRVSFYEEESRLEEQLREKENARLAAEEKEKQNDSSQLKFLLEEPSEDDFEDDYDIDCEDDFERNDYEWDDELATQMENPENNEEGFENELDTSLKLEKKGLELSEIFYETMGKEMIENQFPEYADKIAVGMVGEGSECFGFDDLLSMDHDYGAGFCLWVTKETYEKIGEDLQAAYEELVKKSGYQVRQETLDGKSRVGVIVIDEFYKSLIGLEKEPQSEFEWYQIPTGALAAATNGKVFRDDEKVFSRIRKILKNLYPEKIRIYKMAEEMAKISQTGQYNYARMMVRRDYVTAKIVVAGFMKHAMNMVYLLNRTYEPYYKWQREGIKKLPLLAEIGDILDAIADMPDQRNAWKEKASSYDLQKINTNDQIQMTMEVVAKLILEEMKQQNLVTGEDTYLDHHRKEVLSIADDPLQIAKVRKSSMERIEMEKSLKKEESEDEDFDTVENLENEDLDIKEESVSNELEVKEESECEDLEVKSEDEDIEVSHEDENEFFDEDEEDDYVEKDPDLDAYEDEEDTYEIEEAYNENKVNAEVESQEESVKEQDTLEEYNEAMAIAQGIENARRMEQEKWIKAASEKNTFYQPDDNEELVDKIVKMEWKQFDEVKNEGGRAECQDDWDTFSIMRKSQYMTWTTDVLESFYQDLVEAEAAGWNLITEKYARMMESTAPEKYQEMKDSLPAMSEDKKNVSEQIIKIQVEWMENFKEQYPYMAGNARSIHTSEDTEYNTSYETYLRGELGTYSDETLALYGKMIVDLSKEEKNLAELIMTNTALLYGYASLDEAEEKLARE